MSKLKTSDPALCPSAHMSVPGARLFGVQVRIDGGERQLAYLTETQPITEAVRGLAGSGAPHEVLRVAAPCIEGSCMHWDGQGCRLAHRVAMIMPLAVSAMPRCAIRPSCLWFKQEGQSACLRCPKLATVEHHAPDEPGAVVAELELRDDDTVVRPFPRRADVAKTSS